jgi:glucose/mannose-6-phosphate isomerase
VPGGFQPRAAVGHLTFAMLGALETGGLLPSLTEAVDEVVAELERAVAELGPEAPAERNPAKALAATIGDRIPVIWGIEGIASIAAMRWKTQMNENGKVPAFASAMSELDHNEVVGWTRPYGERCAVIGLRHDAEPEDLSPRFPLSADIARDAGATYDEVRVGTRSALATLFGLVVVGDFASCYVALRRGVDPTPVAVIDRLKAALARVT